LYSSNIIRIIKLRRVRWACDAHALHDKFRQFQWEEMKGIVHLKDLGVDRGQIKMDIQEIVYELEWIKLTRGGIKNG
jgi:hypothetical protein